MRRWCEHFGQTWILDSRSVRYSTDSHDGHLTHKPSGTDLRCAPSARWIRGGSSFSSQLIADLSEFEWANCTEFVLFERQFASCCMFYQTGRHCTRPAEQFHLIRPKPCGCRSGRFAQRPPPCPAGYFPAPG